MSDRGGSRDAEDGREEDERERYGQADAEREEGDEWAGWTHPAVGPDERDRPGESGESQRSGKLDEGDDGGMGGYAPWKAPPSERSQTPREAVRARLDLTDREWYVVETLLLVAPYPLFVFVYLSYPIDETVFLVVTLLYSLFAMYVGLFS